MAGKVKILVVEDEAIVAKDIQRRLEQIGYEVPAAVFAGEDAVKEAVRIRPDLVLMDIMLKGKVDGVEAANRIRERCRIPVIYLTAYSDEHTLRRAEVTQPFGYILKPFDVKELQISIQMALYKHKMDQKMKENQEWFATTLRCISDGVITTDQNGSVTFMNPVAEILTGWRQQEAVGSDLGRVYRVLDEKTREALKNPVARILQAGGVWEPGDPLLLASRDGTVIPVEESVSPIQDERGGILGVVLVFRDITHRREQAAAQEYQVLHDPMTGLPNQGLFYTRLQEAVAAAHQENQTLAVFFLELDRFKEINHEMGRYVGDLLLQQVGQRMWDIVHKTDMVARIEGGKFALFLVGVGQPEEVIRVADRILKAVQGPFFLEEQALEVQVFMGVSLFPQHGQDADTLVRQAFEAMGMARHKGQAYAIYMEAHK